jgi:hypothetical protein
VMETTLRLERSQLERSRNQLPQGSSVRSTVQNWRNPRGFDQDPRNDPTYATARCPDSPSPPNQATAARHAPAPTRRPRNPNPTNQRLTNRCSIQWRPPTSHRPENQPIVLDDDSSSPHACNPSPPCQAVVPHRRPIHEPPVGPNPFQQVIDVDNGGASDNSRSIDGWGRRGEATQEQLPRNAAGFHPSAFRDNR